MPKATVVTTVQPPTWKSHQKTWEHCHRCPLHECRKGKRAVLARGSIPCDVLFVGEAPGQSEQVLGQPFVGPAGHLLNQIIADAGFDVTDYDIMPVRRLFTNLVACIPLSEDGDKVSEPDKKHIEACSPRLTEIIRLTRPRAIVCVGSLAEKWVPNILGGSLSGLGTRTRATGNYTNHQNSRGLGSTQRDMDAEPTSGQSRESTKIVAITHPAAILRANPSMKEIMIQRCVVRLSQLLEELDLEFTGGTRV